MRKLISLIFVLAQFLMLSLLQAQQLVDIKKFNPSICVDYRLATADNQYGFPLYPTDRIYVDSYVAARLGRVQRDLAKEGIGLIIYQGYRPPSVQCNFQARCRLQPHEDYSEEASHYRKGLGVDVTVYYLSGLPLELPTYYGDCSAAAYRDFPFHSANAYHNSYILEKFMTIHGFVPQREKWWHYDLRGWDFAPDLDIEYDDLTKN